MQNINSSKNKLIVISGFLMLTTAVMIAAGPSNNSPISKAEPAGPAVFDSGSDYAAQCTKCHGSDGRSKTAKGRQTQATDLTKSDVSDAKGIRIITNGKGDMPSFKDKLSADQISGLMNYVRSFRR